jgi:hypothetical protein
MLVGTLFDGSFDDGNRVEDRFDGECQRPVRPRARSDDSRRLATDSDWQIPGLASGCGKVPYAAIGRDDGHGQRRGYAYIAAQRRHSCTADTTTTHVRHLLPASPARE